MICGSETTVGTEHICSKMRQLFHFSKPEFDSRVGHHVVESKRSALLVVGRGGLLTRGPVV